MGVAYNLMKKGILACAFSLGFHYTYASPVGYVLEIDLPPATCKLNDNLKRTRQCLEGYSLTVAGLQPENATNKSCETSSGIALSPVQKRVLMRIMPDENIQLRLWRSVGGCVSMNASQYFRMVVNYAERLNIPSEVTTPTSLRVNREWLKQRFVTQNQNLTPASFHFKCDSERRTSAILLTNIEVCYHASGHYKTCRIEKNKNSCPTYFLIQGSY